MSGTSSPLAGAYNAGEFFLLFLYSIRIGNCSLISQKVFANLADTFSRTLVLENNCQFQRHIFYMIRFHNITEIIYEA